MILHCEFTIELYYISGRKPFCNMGSNKRKCEGEREKMEEERREE